jgi:hypothetical protein
MPNNEGTAAGIPLMHALNFLRYGPIASRFGGVINSGVVDMANWTFYAHHPPLVPLVTAGAFWLFGVSNWSARLGSAAFSVAATWLLYIIASRRFGRRVGCLAAVFYAFAPATIAFGGIPDYINSLVVFFILATVEAYLRWRDTGQRLWIVLAAGAFTCGVLSDWPAYYLVPVVGLHYWLTAERRLLPTLALMLPAVLIFVLQVLWMDWIEGSGAFLHQFSSRTSAGITWTMWAREVLIHHVARLHTWPIIILAGSYVALIARNVWHRRYAAVRRHESVGMLLLVAGLHLVIGRAGNVQPWWGVIATAPLALAAALTIEMLLLRQRQGARSRMAIAASAIAVFLCLALPTGWREATLEWAHIRAGGYEPADLGIVIRRVSEPEDGVLTSDYWLEPALWFYADRQIRPLVVDAQSLSYSLAAGAYSLPSGYEQRNGPRPRWFVVPPPHRTIFESLIRELDARFARRIVDGYAVYRLY